jgi:hypothetical protein
MFWQEFLPASLDKAIPPQAILGDQDQAPLPAIEIPFNFVW